jgi:hypothetical protein
MTSGPAEPRITVVKTLFAVSGNLCQFVSASGRCEKRLTDPRWKKVRARICHIYGESNGSSRYEEHMTDEERRAYENLMLMCPNHHTEVDDLLPDDYPAEVLLEMKRKTEAAELTPPKSFNDPEYADFIARSLIVITDHLARTGPLPNVANHAVLRDEPRVPERSGDANDLFLLQAAVLQDRDDPAGQGDAPSTDDTVVSSQPPIPNRSTRPTTLPLQPRGSTTQPPIPGQATENLSISDSASGPAVHPEQRRTPDGPTGAYGSGAYGSGPYGGSSGANGPTGPPANPDRQLVSGTDDFHSRFDMQVSQILGYENLKYLGHNDDAPGPISVYETTRQGQEHLTPDQRTRLTDLAQENRRTIEARIPGLTTEVFGPGNQ